VIARPFITDVLNDGYSVTASLVVARDVWPISVGQWQCWSMTSWRQPVEMTRGR